MRQTKQLKKFNKRLEDDIKERNESVKKLLENMQMRDVLEEYKNNNGLFTNKKK
jgi:hypothetical protein